MTGDGWDAYLAGFHAARAGITERVLAGARDDDGDAYDWLAAALPPHGLVLDVACGSAPLAPRLVGRYLGTDVSEAELVLARARGARVEHAPADAQPLGDGAAAAVACSMALMVLPDPVAALREARRVLEPGGVLAALVPTNRVGPRDLPASAALVAALGRAPSYRNDRALVHLDRLLADAGLALRADEHRVFRFPVPDAPAARLFVESLYLPHGDEPAVRARAARAVRRLGRLGVALPVPVRRVVARAA